jgi:benzaldehyde dehydrogenase (NAD)
VAALAEKAKNLPIGDPKSGTVAIGPIIDGRQLERIDSMVQSAVVGGARLAAGGARGEGWFYPPTVLADLDPEHEAWKEEIFGPVAPVRSFSTIDEAVEMANASNYGLSLSILGDVGMAMKIADRVDSGKVHINEQTVSDEPNSPFGGVKDSGNGGRIGGAAANMEAFTETQWLTMRPEIAPYPF